MKIAGLIVAAAAAFSMPSASAQTKSKAPDLTGPTYIRHVCDCRKPGFDFPRCMERRLGYSVQAATAANVVCPDPKAKGKKG